MVNVSFTMKKGKARKKKRNNPDKKKRLTETPSPHRALNEETVLYASKASKTKKKGCIKKNEKKRGVQDHLKNKVMQRKERSDIDINLDNEPCQVATQAFIA